MPLPVFHKKIGQPQSKAREVKNEDEQKNDHFGNSSSCKLFASSPGKPVPRLKRNRPIVVSQGFFFNHSTQKLRASSPGRFLAFIAVTYSAIIGFTAWAQRASSSFEREMNS